MTAAVERLARHALEARLADLPAAAATAAKTFILDSIGAGVAGSGSVFADAVLQTAKGWGAGRDATVWGSGARLPAASAALVNGFQMHGQEFDCVHERAVVHPMATILAVAWASAERRGGVTGAELLVAVTVAVDIAATLGIASRGGLRFFRPGTAGGFGATAAAARLRGLDHARLMDAFGIYYSQTGGTMQAHLEGAPVLAMQIGFNARNAIVACDLAAAGMGGPHDVLEGPFGYYTLIEAGGDLAPPLAELGRVWRVSELSHKPFPCGRATHGGVTGILRLKAEHAIDQDTVTAVRLIAPPLIHRLVARPDMSDPPAHYARLCMAYVAAVALERGTVELADFLPHRLGDPTLHNLAARIGVEIDDNKDANALGPQRVEIDLADGRRLATDVADVLGSPANPLGRAAQLAKFRQCCASGARPLSADRVERIIELVDGLETLTGIDRLAALVSPLAADGDR
ncbi:MAG: MmgE/PrpD family protein [Alphaproteobacteria bacterium]|nr:MmgE/PrpD family protein [Alphaproteobacteria bacterium]